MCSSDLQGQTSLDWFYFTYPLTYPFIGTIAADFAFWAPMEKPLGVVTKLAVCAILVVTLVYLDGAIQELRLHTRSPLIEATLFGLIYGAIVTLAVPRFLRLWGGIAALSVCFASSMTSPGLYSPTRCSLARYAELAIDATHRFVRSEQLAQGLGFAQVYTWANKGEILPVAEIGRASCRERV